MTKANQPPPGNMRRLHNGVTREPLRTASVTVRDFTSRLLKANIMTDTYTSYDLVEFDKPLQARTRPMPCLLYTSDAADE